MHEELTERFLRYVAVDTQSSETSGTHPSTEKQFRLAEMLAGELETYGASVVLDREHAYIYATIPAAGADFESVPALGFIAHMDTSPAVSGKNVKARIIRNYQGDDPVLKPDEFPELLHHIGEDLIATDGTTLLGADDKAGVSEIMNMVQYFHEHPEEEHCEIRIAFTPDEEIGEGTLFFDSEKFGAKEAYTVDGGKLGVIEYECFNAASAKVTFAGRSVHPGSGKNAMINASLLAMEFNAMLPADETPEHTEGYEGFFYLEKMTGDTEKAVLSYILRDHDRQKFENRKDTLRKIAAYLNEKYGKNNVHGINPSGQELVKVEITDQYYNMAEVMKDHMNLVHDAEEVLRELGIKPSTSPIRGGTDGAVLSFRGIPCPNLCTGGYNYHSRYEYASIPEMEKTAELLIRLAEKTRE
ncbi:MAG: peptidase T [Eubacteriales bacterium]|jgi:tripeptide aminopeptidase